MRKPWGHIFLGMLLLQFSATRVYAQQLKLGNNPASINRSAVLQLDSRNQGLLLTRIKDTALINAFSPPDGMIIYFTDSNQITHVNHGPNAGVYQRKNNKWVPLLGIKYGNNGQVLRTVNNSLKWEYLALDSLSNISITSPDNGDILKYNGTDWVNSSNGGGGWLLGGNAGTDPDQNYLGTSDYEPLVIKVNNQQVGYFGTTSGGNSNIAFGLNASAGYQSVAFGYNATNTGNGSVTLGYGAHSTSAYTITIGAGKAGDPATTTSSNNTIAIGVGVNVSGFQSTAIGNGASADGQQALSLGSGASASGYQSTAIGNEAQASQQNSTAIGNGASAPNANTIILGNNNVKVGILTTSPQYPLDVNGQIRGTNVTPSDIRYKKNLQELHHVLSAIDSLHGYTYFFRTKEFKDKNFSKTRQIGMIAQEVEKYFPELVSTDENGYKSLNYAQFTAILLEAVKAQQAEIDSLKKKLLQHEKAVAGQLEILSKRIEALENQVKQP